MSKEDELTTREKEILSRIKEAQLVAKDEGIMPVEFAERKVKYYQEQVVLKRPQFVSPEKHRLLKHSLRGIRLWKDVVARLKAAPIFTTKEVKNLYKLAKGSELRKLRCEALMFGGKDPPGYCRRAKEGKQEGTSIGSELWDEVHDGLKAEIAEGIQLPYYSESEVPTTPAK